MGVKIREKVKDSGSWWVFINHRGRRTSRQVGTQRAAMKVKEQIEARLKLGHDALPEQKKSVPTLQEYYEEVFKPVYIESAIASSNAASYKNNFKNHLIPAFGGLRLNEIAHEKMEEFVSDLVKKPLAKATIKTIVKELSKLFNHARKRKLIADNPASGLGQLYSQAKAKHEVIEPLTREEVPIFLEAVRKHSPKHYAMFFTAIHTGVRVGELAGLQSGDIDFHGKYLIVQRNIDRVHRKIVPTKTKRIRRIDLTDELIGVLKAHMQEQREYWMRHPRRNPDGTFDTTPPEWLFPNDDGGWLDMNNIAKRHFLPCLRKAGLHARRPYDLRHTFASLLLTDGTPIQYVSQQMGHANIQLTVNTYGHLEPGANRHWINRLPGAAPAPNRLEATNEGAQ